MVRQDTRAPCARWPGPAPCALRPAPGGLAQRPALTGQRPAPCALRPGPAPGGLALRPVAWPCARWPALTGQRPRPIPERPAPSTHPRAPSALRPAPCGLALRPGPAPCALRSRPGLLRKNYKKPDCCEKPTKSKGIFTRGVPAPDSGSKPPGGHGGQKGQFWKTHPVPIFRARRRKPIRFYPTGASAGTRSGSVVGTRLASRSSRDMRCTVRSAKPVSAAIWWLLCPR